MTKCNITCIIIIKEINLQYLVYNLQEKDAYMLIQLYLTVLMKFVVNFYKRYFH